MNCYKFNEGTYHKIENFLEGKEPDEGFQEQTFYKSYYSPATLMNDWFEKRSVQVQEKLHEPPLSENMDKYRKPCRSEFPDRKAYFNKIFESYGLGQELFLDHLGFSYYENYVSSYDLSYNHLTKGLCGPYPRSYHKGKYLPENDLSKIYGNLTQWGLKERVYQSMNREICREAGPTTETSFKYVQHDLNAVKKLNDFGNFKKVKVTY